MAAIMRNELLPLLRASGTCHSLSVRWKKKPPNWRDPSDLSWAAPLMEKIQQKQQGGAAEVQQPPAMLHMVSRIRSLYGRPHWEKETMKSLGLLEKKHEVVVHKNTPQMNKMLETVKHLIKIVPITFPNGLPADEDELRNCVLRKDGRFEVTKTLHPLQEQMVEITEEDRPIWEMDEKTVERQTTKVMNNFELSREYFPAKYVYKYNQDGKEHRYSGDHNIGTNSDWH